MKNIILEKRIYNRINPLENDRILTFFLYLFWIGQFFATVGGLDSPNLRLHKIYNPIRDFYDTQFNQFPGFELIAILLSFVIFLKFIEYYSFSNKQIKIFIISSLIFIIISLLNPENAFQFGIIEFLKFRITRSLLFFALFSAIVLLLNTQVRFYLMQAFFKTGLKVAVIKVSFDLVSFFLGLSPLNIFFKSVPTFGGDILVWFGIFHILTFIIYIYTNDKKYFIFSLLFFLTLIFSYQRTTLFVVIISDFLIFLYSRKYLINFQKKVFYKKVVAFLVIILVLVPLILRTNQGKDLFWRFASAIEFTGLVTLPDQANKPEYSDSGHLRQSLLTTDYFLKHKNLFWGGGLNRRTENYLHIRGQSSGGVHNNLVSTWQYFGIPGLMFLFFIIIYFFKTFISTFKNEKNMLNLIAGGISIYFIVRTCAGWFAGDHIFLFSQTVSQFVLLVAGTSFINAQLQHQIIFPKILKINWKTRKDILELLKFRLLQ